MAAANIEQRLLVLLHQGIVLSCIEYACALLTISPTKTVRLERIQNEAMRIILGCTKDTPRVSMRFPLDLPTIVNRNETWRVRSYLRIKANKEHPLHEELIKEKGCRLMRGRSWLSQVEDTLRKICDPSGIETGEEWITVPPQFQTAFTVITSIKKSQKKKLRKTANKIIYNC